MFTNSSQNELLSDLVKNRHTKSLRVTFLGIPVLKKCNQCRNRNKRIQNWDLFFKVRFLKMTNPYDKTKGIQHVRRTIGCKCVNSKLVQIEV